MALATKTTLNIATQSTLLTTLTPKRQMQPVNTVKELPLAVVLAEPQHYQADQLLRKTRQHLRQEQGEKKTKKTAKSTTSAG